MTKTAVEPQMFTTQEVCYLADISYRMADLWVTNGYLSPDYARPGSGHPRIWPEDEVVKAVALATMVRAGISHAKAAQLIADGQRATLLVEPLPRTLT